MGNKASQPTKETPQRGAAQGLQPRPSPVAASTAGSQAPNGGPGGNGLGVVSPLLDTTTPPPTVTLVTPDAPQPVQGLLGITPRPVVEPNTAPAAVLTPPVPVSLVYMYSPPAQAPQNSLITPPPTIPLVTPERPRRPVRPAAVAMANNQATPAPMEALFPEWRGSPSPERESPKVVKVDEDTEAAVVKTENEIKQEDGTEATVKMEPSTDEEDDKKPAAGFIKKGTKPGVTVKTEEEKLAASVKKESKVTVKTETSDEGEEGEKNEMGSVDTNPSA